MDDQYCLRGNNHPSALLDIAYKFLEHESLVDVTLACQKSGQVHTFKAHQIILSACSSYFESVLLQNTHSHPIIFLKDVRKEDLENILTYMYRGEVNVPQDRLKDILITAKSLMVRGLTLICDEDNLSEDNVNTNSSSIHHGKRKSLSGDESDVRLKMNRVEHEGEERGEKESQCSLPIEEYAVLAKKYRNGAFHNFENQTAPDENPMDYSTVSVHHKRCSPLHSEVSTRDIDDSRHNEASENARTITSSCIRYPSVVKNENENDTNSEDAFRSNSSSDRHNGEYGSEMTSRLRVPERILYSPEVSIFPTHPPNNNNINNEVLMTVPINTPYSSFTHAPKRVGHFQLKWMQIYNWLQYDEETRKMFCKFCRRWGNCIPNIRTSFVDGNCNFRFEIVKHHHCSKSHQTCMNKEEIWRSENKNLFVT